MDTVEAHTSPVSVEPEEQPVVLLVDDTAPYRRRTALELAACGYTVLEASDGEDALLMSRDITPDAVITDLQMPHLDGLQLCRALRELRAFENVPLVLSTASPTDDSRLSEVERIEGLRLVRKPIDGYDLAALVDEMLAPEVDLAGEAQVARLSGSASHDRVAHAR